MGSITLIVEEKCEFEQDEREFEPGYHRRTRDYQLARRSEMNLLHQSYCWNCGKTKATKIHKGPITREVEVPDNVEEMYENAQKADSRDFDIAEETAQRGWQALALMSHVSDPDRQARACMSEEAAMESDVNWSTAVAWFTAVEDGRWCRYSASHQWFGSSRIILFDPAHAPTAQVAEQIDDALGPDSGNVVFDEDALEEAKAEAERENLTSGYLRHGMPMTVDAEEVRLKMHELDNGEYDRDQDKLITLAVQKIPHTFDEGFDQEDPEDDDSPYLCVCGLKTTAEMHREEIPGQEKIEFEEE